MCVCDISKGLPCLKGEGKEYHFEILRNFLSDFSPPCPCPLLSFTEVFPCRVCFSHVALCVCVCVRSCAFLISVFHVRSLPQACDMPSYLLRFQNREKKLTGSPARWDGHASGETRARAMVPKLSCPWVP